jgi:hypothetical protein
MESSSRLVKCPKKTAMVEVQSSWCWCGGTATASCCRVWKETSTRSFPNPSVEAVATFEWWTENAALQLIFKKRKKSEHCVTIGGGYHRGEVSRQTISTQIQHREARHFKHIAQKRFANRVATQLQIVHFLPIASHLAHNVVP